MGRASIGELEHLILLAIRARGADASALAVRALLENEGRAITRGALYRALDRLGDKGMIDWEVEEPSAERGGHSRRVYRLTEGGRETIEDRRATLQRLWAAAEGGA